MDPHRWARESIHTRARESAARSHEESAGMCNKASRDAQGRREGQRGTQRVIHVIAKLGSFFYKARVQLCVPNVRNFIAAISLPRKISRIPPASPAPALQVTLYVALRALSGRVQPRARALFGLSLVAASRARDDEKAGSPGPRWRDEFLSKLAGLPPDEP